MGAFEDGWKAASDRAESGTGQLGVLLDEITALVRRFVVMTSAQAHVAALWIAHTHAFEAAEATPFLAVTSAEKRSGKSRLLEVASLLVARPWYTGRASAAVLVRKTAAECPTLLLDESDSAFKSDKEYAEALRGILNTGHRRGGCISLCVGQGAQITYRDFSTFGPKAIAGIGQLPDTVADRSIPIRLKRRSPTERPVDRYRERLVASEAAPLRERLARWATVATPSLGVARPSIPEVLNDRMADGAEPLLAIADVAGDEWPDRARRALVELAGDASADDDSIGTKLLRDCRAIFDQGSADRLSSADLLSALVAIEESPWSEINHGKQLTPRRLAELLKPHQIIPGSIRLADGTTPKGYRRAAFEDAWSRYLTFPKKGSENATTPQANTDAGFPTFSKRHADELVADEKRGIGNGDGPCGGVADDPLLPGMDDYRVGFDL